MEDIAIVGIGLRLPGNCKSPNELWENLINSFDGVVKVPPERWSSSFYENGVITSMNAGLLPFDEWKKFDPLFFGISPKDCAGLDPQERMMLTLTHEALEDAQIPASSLRGSKTGVFIGVSNVDFNHNYQRYSILDQAPTVLNDVYSFGMIANRVSYCFDFRGPSVSVDSACSSSLLSTDMACQSLVSGSSDVAVSGGVNALFDPETTVGYSSLGVISDKCRSFDSNGKGFVRSEGGGIVVLKRLADAEKCGNRIYAIIRSRSSNNDGHYNKETISTPSSASQSENIKRALSLSSMSASDIYYVEAHATGTVVGDPIEVQALSNVFTQNHSADAPLKIGSIKANIGHLESAAGIASLIKVCLLLKNRKLVPNVNLNTLNPRIPFKDMNIQVVTQVEDLPTDRSILMGINSFGIGGTNCHMILEEYKQSTKSVSIDEKDKLYIIPISCNSELSLNNYIKLLEESKDYQDSIQFKEFALHQTLSKSQHFSHRKVYIAKDWQDFIDEKATVQAQLPLMHEGKKVIIVFCGQGPQWNQMGMQLYSSNPLYKSKVDYVDSLFKKLTNYSIIEKMNEPANQSNDIHKPIIAQPSLFIFQICLYELYRSWGIKPSIVIGHSFGDITAAYVSGKLSLETAVRVVYYRSIYQNETIGSGKMLVVGINETEYQTKFSQSYPDLEIACYNGPDSIVITGNELNLIKISKEMKELEIFNTFLRTPCSFHSSNQDVIKGKILQSLEDLESSTSSNSIQWYSTVLAELYDNQTPVTNQYIYDNIRQPVKFRQTLSAIANDLGDQLGEYVFLEIAPHPTLTNLITHCLPSAKVISSLQRNKDENVFFLASLASLYCLGVIVNFSNQFTKSDILNLSWKESTSVLPKYQWDSELYWYETELSKYKRLNGPSTTLLGNPSTFNGQLSYHSDINIKCAPYQFLRDHRVKDKPLFPGAGYIDVTIQALKINNQDIVINRMEFLNPFFLNESGETQKMQTYLEKINNNCYNLDFFNKNGTSHSLDLPWIKSAKANVTLRNPSMSTSKFPLKEFSESCNLVTLCQDDLYEKASRVGLNYGPAFRRIKSMKVGEKTTLSTLELGNLEYPSHVLNTLVIDNCAHGLFGLLEERRQFIFKSTEDLKVDIQLMNQLESNPPKELYLATTMTHSDNYHYSGNCSLITPNGEVIMSIGKFTVYTQERLRMKKIKFPAHELYDTFLQSKEPNFTSISEIQVAPLIDDSINCQYILEATPEAVRFLCHSMMKNFEGFKLDDELLNSPIHDSMFRLKLQRSRSNDMMFTRCIEMFKEYRDFLTEDTLTDEHFSRLSTKYPKLINREFEVIGTATDVLTEVLLGNERATNRLFENGLLHTLYTKSAFLKYYFNQTTHLVLSAIEQLIIQKEKKVIKILEIGGGTGSLTHILIKALDELLQGQDAVEVYYTFTDVSAFFVTPMMEFYESHKLKSNLKLKFKILDLEADTSEQGFLPGCFDMVLMSFVIHVVPDMKLTLSNIQKIMAPNGWLLFIEPNYKVPMIDIVFGGFAQIWSYSDEIRDHYALKPIEWVDILSEEFGFTNTRVFGPNDHNGKQLSISSGMACIVLSQRTAIHSLPATTNNITLIVDEYQPIDPTLNRYSIVKTNQIDTSQHLLLQSSHIIFLSAIEQLSSETYQSVTFDLATLLNIFVQKEHQPFISMITKNCKHSNYFSNSLVGIVRTALNDYQELHLTHIDIDSEFNNKTLQRIIQISSNYSSLGEYEYYIQKERVYVERAFHINQQLLQHSIAYEKDTNKLGCLVNINLEHKLFHRTEELSAHDIEASVQAIGLNFKDHLYYRKLLPQELMNQGDPFHPPYGLEFSGIVTRVGNEVKNFKIGDEVIGFFSDSMKSHKVDNENRFISKPSNISFVEGASIPTTYGTVYHSLVNVCHLDPENETVLVHSASGGVGIAALNILRWLKCKRVYATAGSKAKIEYLKSNYSDILIEVFDSHSTDFAHLIHEQCDGVDVLLNTLSVDFMNANFSAMAPFGRIADLSLTHVYKNDPLDYGCFKKDVVYSPIDFQLVINRKIGYVQSIMKKILMAIEDGELKLPNIESYPIKKVKKAVESMKNRTHIGKIVVDCSSVVDEVLKPMTESNVSPVLKSDFMVDISNSVLITGQKGISLELILWICKFSRATDIIVLSKSPLKSRLEKLINQMESKRIHFYQTDVTNKNELEDRIKDLHTQYPPIETIFHLAAVFEDVTMTDISFENIKKVHDPKVIGAYNLHQVTIENNIPIKQFIIFSSISSFNGSTAQPAYNSSNLVVDSLCQYRNETLGLVSKSIRWGPILGEGRVAESAGIIEFFHSRGMESLLVSQFLGGLESIVSQSKFLNVLVGNISTSKCYDYHPQIRSKIDHLINGETGKKTINNQKSQNVNEIITNTLASLLSISTNKLGGDTKLKDFGVDSLMTVQVKSFFDTQFEKELFNVTQIPSLTINNIVSKIQSKQSKISVNHKTLNIMNKNQNYLLTSIKL